MNLRRRMERDLEADISEHIEMETRDNIERGMSPEEARRAALLKFGNVLRVTEDTHAVWTTWPERTFQDARYALRGLRRNPVFAAVAILTLAVGIGMNTAVFSVVSAVLIKPLPYAEPSRIIWLANYNKRFKFEASSAPDFMDWRRQAQSFEAMAGYGTLDSTIQDGDQSAKHAFVYITPEFWRIAGVSAARGRLFAEGDRDVMVITWRLFEQQFGGDPRTIGRVVLVDGRRVSIIGVLPRNFRFLPPQGMVGGMSGEAEAYTPNNIVPEAQTRSGRGILITFVVAKLKSGVTVDQARAELQSIQARIARENPSWRDFYNAAELRATPLQEKLVGGSRRALLVLLGAVAFVLLIACVNMGNLLLARATARQREIAIRAAIGAGRNRLLRHFLVEGLTLALLGGTAGLALAGAADVLLIGLSPAAIPRLSEIGIDWRVLLFTLTISILAGVAFGLAPVFSLSTDYLYSVLKGEGRTSSSGLAGLQVRRLLVAAELALALVLLTGAGLMLKSFSRMYAHPPSFEPEKIGLVKVWLSGPAYRERPPAYEYARRLLERVSQIPGVQAVAFTNGSGSGGADVDGPPRFPPGQAPMVFYRSVSSDYPRVVGIPLLKGRWMTDDEPAPVAIVNETFVRRVFGKDEPLGQRLRLGQGNSSALASIVGVVGDLKISRLDADPDPEILIPYKDTPVFRKFDVLIKTPGTPASVLPEIRKVVQRLDPSQPPYGVTTLEDALAESIAPRRFNLLLLGSFAASAVLLALIGIYGVMSYAVTQRTQEIGIRMALGARRGKIVRMVVSQAMSVTVVGIVVGIAAALGLTRLMATLLFDVKPNDPLTFAAVALALAATALLASWIPAIRAARVDPLRALRYE